MITTTVTMITLVETTPTTTGKILTRDAVEEENKLMYSTHSQIYYTYMVTEK